MKQYNFMFGYESPVEYEVNNRLGSDDESSALVIITAGSEAEALAWGAEIAEQFLRDLFHDPAVSWKQRRYASWIEDDLSDYVRYDQVEIPQCQIGEYPDMSYYLRN